MPARRPSITADGKSLAEIVAAIDQRGGLPPVDQWNPERCGDSEMVIRRDGSWTHQGSVIARPAMVRLFSTVLRREPDGRHVLVTPVEKLDIEVENTAFRATQMRSEGEGEDRTIAFTLDSGDAVVAGPDHPIRLVATDHGPSPRLAVRHGLEAEIERSLYYDIAEWALAEDHDPVGIWSDGAFFALESAA